jgi:hypothetical protein
MMGGAAQLQQQQAAQAAAAAAAASTAANAADSVILEEEFDPDYEPTEEEIIEYAQFLQMDLVEDRDLFWIAREGLKAPLPAPWKRPNTLAARQRAAQLLNSAIAALQRSVLLHATLSADGWPQSAHCIRCCFAPVIRLCSVQNGDERGLLFQLRGWKYVGSGDTGKEDERLERAPALSHPRSRSRSDRLVLPLHELISVQRRCGSILATNTTRIITKRRSERKTTRPQQQRQQRTRNPKRKNRSPPHQPL